MSLPNHVLLVVARYLENIDWLKPYASQCFIVNKGYLEEASEDSLVSFPNVVKHENIGRESQTYLLFIIKNYHCLPEIVVFTQGKIHDHFSECASILFSRFIHEAKIHGASLPTHIHSCSDTTCKSSWDPDWNVFVEEEEDEEEEKEKIQMNTSKKVVTRFILENCYLHHNKIRFDTWFQENIGRPYTFPFKIYRNAIFAVHKNRILSRPLSFYEDLLRYCSHHVDPAEGHFLERSWYYIFNEN